MPINILITNDDIQFFFNNRVLADIQNDDSWIMGAEVFFTSLITSCPYLELVNGKVSINHDKPNYWQTIDKTVLPKLLPIDELPQGAQVLEVQGYNNDMKELRYFDQHGTFLPEVFYYDCSTQAYQLVSSVNIWNNCDFFNCIQLAINEIEQCTRMISESWRPNTTENLMSNLPLLELVKHITEVIHKAEKEYHINKDRVHEAKMRQMQKFFDAEFLRLTDAGQPYDNAANIIFDTLLQKSNMNLTNMTSHVDCIE